MKGLEQIKRDNEDAVASTARSRRAEGTLRMLFYLKEEEVEGTFGHDAKCMPAEYIRGPELRSEVKGFAQAMELRMRQFDERHGFDGYMRVQTSDLYLQLGKEIGSLAVALCSGDHRAILREAADAANVAMLIFYRASVG